MTIYRLMFALLCGVALLAALVGADMLVAPKDWPSRFVGGVLLGCAGVMAWCLCLVGA